jgi:NAD+ synthase
MMQVVRPAESEPTNSLASALAIDAEHEVARITSAIRRILTHVLRRRGAVVGISGGIDSSVVAALCARALGADRVLGVFSPEQDSSPESQECVRALIGSLGISFAVTDITPTLVSLGCYRERDEAIRSVIPEYGTGAGVRWRSKLVRPDVTAGDHYSFYHIVVEASDGRKASARLNPHAYRQIVAATNFKQRTRKMVEYFHSDRLQYAVAGTSNRLEHDQGFFVKNGDGASDFGPIAHLYKSQVYALAEVLGIPAEIRSRIPSTDTYSLPQNQEEFYFSVPYRMMDMCLYAFDHGVSAENAAAEIGVTDDRVERIYRDIQSKRRIARYLHSPSLLIGGSAAAIFEDGA